MSKSRNRIECVGVDGEGYSHGSVYSYMACASTKGTVSTIENLRGIATHQALDFILNLPRTINGSRVIPFGFSLGYDYTKILQDLPDRDLWLLARPEERNQEIGPPLPVYFTGGGTRYALNMLGSRLSIQRMFGHLKECDDLECEGCKAGPKTVLWDVFKFFQSSFVKACLDWEVISSSEFEILSEMKKKRPEFAKPRSETDPEWLEIKSYCQLECAKMADLATRLLNAHEEAGLVLKQYFGAGSTGAAMLDKMGAKKFIRRMVLSNTTDETKTEQKTKSKASLPSTKTSLPSTKSSLPSTETNPKTSYGKVVWRRIEYDEALRYAMACAFFGGRFEIRQYGPIPQKCWSYDISSAYPYAFTFLPCLVHGKWRYIKAETCGTTSDNSTTSTSGNSSTIGTSIEEEIEKAQTAIVRYRLPWISQIGKVKDESSRLSWGPFPFRMGRGLSPFCNEGDIIFPVTSGGGWICRDEYLAGREFAKNVHANEAWIYETDCDCKVLRGLMPENYRLRCRWGKEGKGQVAKLGQNSCYGKCAQTKGKLPPYQEFVWASMTTASCRAQLLRAMKTNIDGIVLLATDGIISTNKLNLETPRDTGTYDTIDIKSDKKKPLGGWEEKELPNGVFLIRPGIAFPLGTEKLDEKGQKKAEGEFKARGIGKHVLRTMRETVLDSWETKGPEDLITEKQLFFGMKSQVHMTPKGLVKRTERYGRFGMQPQVISYKPTPKRPGIDKDAIRDIGGGKNHSISSTTRPTRFLTWALAEERISIPYGPILGKPKTVSPLLAELLKEKQLSEDQADSTEDDTREF
jgi:hypothetical protein